MMLANRLFPVTTFNDLRREMDRVLRTFSENGNDRPLSADGYPPVNVWEDGQAFHIEAEVPGVDIKEIDIQVVGNELTIKGTRAACCCEETFHRRERAVGAFGRVVTLPTDVNPDQVDAVLKNGVLTITLPKAETARAKKIAIKTV